MSRRTEIQVGLTVLGALAILLWGVTWLKELSLSRSVKVWHVRFPQTGGLGASDEVQVNGIRKGSVSKIALTGDHVVVDLALATDVSLTTDSRVAIRNVGLMGEKVIAVVMKTTGSPLSQRDTIEGVYELGMGEVMAGVGTSMEAMDRLVQSLNSLSARLEKSGDLDRTLANFRETSEELKGAMKENRGLLRQTLTDASAVAHTAKELTTDREAQLKRTLDSFERSSANLERLSSRMDSLRASLQSVTGKLDRGEGTLGKLINDEGLYSDVSESVKQIRAVVEDLKKNPKKYINLSIF